MFRNLSDIKKLRGPGRKKIPSRSTARKKRTNSITDTDEYKNFVAGPGQIKRPYNISETAAKKLLVQEVDRILVYLRARRVFDGTLELDPKQNYKSRMIRKAIKLLVLSDNGNFLGVQVAGDAYLFGMVGDTMYQEFFYEFHTRTMEEWEKNPRSYWKLIKKFSKMYFRRGSNGWRGGDNKKSMQGLPFEYIGMGIKTRHTDEVQTDEFCSYKDMIYQYQLHAYEKNFNWTKMSHKQTKKQTKRETEREKSRTRQSLLAFQALCKHNVLIDDRFNMTALCNTQDYQDKDKILLWDHRLQREHIFLRIGTNDMSDVKSIWKGAMGGIDAIRHFQEKVYSSAKKDMMPQLPPFKMSERYWDHRRELDISEGGYVIGGAHNRDSVDAINGKGAADEDNLSYIMRGEYILTTASVTYLFGNGCNFTGGRVLSLLMQWAHGLKHLHNLTGGKHYSNPDSIPKKDVDEEEG